MTLLGALSMGCGILLAARLAYAEALSRTATPSALTRAAQLDRFAPPAAYFERLAELDPGRASYWLDAALQANPRLTSAWIAQGLAAERAKNPAAAERDLLQAASLDHQYLPAWTLANFYFRQNRPAPFWVWARRAAALTYDDFRPLLALAHALEPDPRLVLQNLGGLASGWSQKLLDADLDYLVQHNQLDRAQQAARLLLARKSPAAAPRLLALADRQIRAGHARDALELWNAAWNASSPPVDPVKDALANGDLATSPTGVAFDWRLSRGEGFSSAWEPRRLTFQLSGEQPEACALLEQIVPLDPARRYRLRFEYLTQGLASQTGLAWDLDGDSASIQPAVTWQSAQADLHLNQPSHARQPPRARQPRLATLRLLYRRQPGTVRAEGRLELRSLNLEPL